MPYKNKEDQRKFQREWKAARRQEWLDQNGPCVKCGSNIDLEIDHKDRSLKEDHKIWSWTEEKRNAELAKCQVLCKICHKAKTRSECIAECGTRSAYDRGCRCARCTEAKKLSMRDYKVRKRLSIMV